MKEDRFLFFGSHAEYKFLLGDLTLGLTFIGLVVLSVYVSFENIRPVIEGFSDSSNFWPIIFILLFISVPIGLAVSELSLMVFSEIVYSYSLNLFRKISKENKLCMALIRSKILCEFLREFRDREKGEDFFGFLGLYQRYIRDKGIMDFTAKNISRASGMRVYFRGIAFSALIALIILCGSYIGESGGKVEIFTSIVYCILTFTILYGIFYFHKMRRFILTLIFENRALIWFVSVGIMIIPFALIAYSSKFNFWAYYAILITIMILSIIASAFADVYSKIHIIKSIIGYFLTTGNWPEYWPKNWRIWRSVDEAYGKT